MEAFRVRSGDADLAAVKFGAGRRVLLAHPLVFSKAYVAGGVDVLGPRAEVAALDLRGHGETEAATLSLDAMADDLGAVLDALGWPSAAVGGTSLGAAAALRFALRHPGRVERLLLDLPGFGPGSSRPPEKAERLAEAFARADFEEAARRIAEGLSAPRAAAWTAALRADWTLYDPARLGPKLAAALRASTSWRVADRWPEDLAGIRVPTSILAVKGDPVHPWETAETMARTIPGARLSPRVPSLDPKTIAAQWAQELER
jgi:pimeloyl-ACP methyl ester carboxylesterase